MNENFIVSIASYSKRINTLHICLESLYAQTILPQKIILYLDNSVSPNDIPQEIFAYTKKGLEIVFVSDDIKSHNKYYYTFKTYPDAIVITVDDDVIYEKNTFYNLLKTHDKYPNAVCSNRVTYMKFFPDNTLMPYTSWISEYDKLKSPSKKLVAVGVGGVLYPPHIFTEEIFDKSCIINLALTADDLWLKIMQLRNNVPVVWTGQLPQHPPRIPKTMEVSLWRNINKYMNDEYIKRLITYYDIDLYALVNEEDEYGKRTTINNHNSCI